MSGLIFTFIVGVFFLILSFVLKAYPHLLTNYDSLEDASELSKTLMAKNVADAFMIGGIIIFGIGVAAVLLKKEIPGVTALLVSVFVPAYIFFKNRFLLKPVSKTLLCIIFITLIIISGLIIYSEKSAKISIRNAELVITGLHGEDISLDNIKYVSLVQNIPQIKFRDNGYSRGDVKKGYFELKDWATCKLLLESKKAPFILICLNTNKRIILNWEDDKLTNEYYTKLQSAL